MIITQVYAFDVKIPTIFEVVFELGPVGYIYRSGWCITSAQAIATHGSNNDIVCAEVDR